jgi:hypothetical protein
MKTLVTAAALLLMAVARGQVANQKLLTLLQVVRDSRRRGAPTMRLFWTAAVVLIVAACGQVQGNPSGTPQASPSPLLFAVLEAKGTANAWTYNTVAIVGLDGNERAKSTFTPMPVPSLGCMGALIPPSAHVAAGKVYFADAKGVVRSLAIDGTVAVAATFAMTSTQQMLSFAVSPDGTRIVGTIFTVPASATGCGGAASGTFTFDAYTAPVGGAAKLVYHDSWTTSRNVLALTGWDSVGPIGTYPTVWASQGGGPGSALGAKVRVDAATVRPGSVLSDPNKCQVWDSNSTGAFVCMGDAVMTGGGTADQRVNQPVSIRNADGTEAWRFTAIGQNAPFGPFLSPDGTRVMVCCNDLNLSDSHELLVGRDGTQVNLAAGFGASGWLDQETMVGWVNSNMAYVASSSPGLAVSMGFPGLFVGTVRG